MASIVHCETYRVPDLLRIITLLYSQPGVDQNVGKLDSVFRHDAEETAYEILGLWGNGVGDLVFGILDGRQHLLGVA